MTGDSGHLRRQIENLRQRNDRLSERVERQARELKTLRRKAGGGKSRKEEPRSVFVDGAVLPPHDARPCGPTYRDDALYLRSADHDAKRLVERLGVRPGSSLLDVGCGPGRLAIGLIRQVGEDLDYHGVDVNATWLGWAKSNLTPAHPRYKFTRLDVKSDRYNPSGATLPEDFRFPFADESFDSICLFSVFTHMMPDDVRVYLRDFYRILRPGGRVLATAFLEDGVPEVEENPAGYLGQNWSGPLHCVRYRRSFFNAMIREAGLKIEREDSNVKVSKERDPNETYQRHLYLSKPPGNRESSERV
ncbi:methyltransferase domain-containing protein [Rubrobacter radiotolerans]|uniref:methyltransferase domain-containing protein n=1 Tax=Rubrobacter radiotolerans TaxID=42256 RepID=UPI00135643AB|nr:methyltransferase domain-containing protein [Rubrobacter radiotolerans]